MNNQDMIDMLKVVDEEATPKVKKTISESKEKSKFMQLLESIDGVDQTQQVREYDEPDAYELFDMYLDQSNMHHFEGDTRNLQEVIRNVCGYHSFEEFFSDNPGAQQEVVQWIQQWVDRNHVWKRNLEGLVDIDDDDDDDDNMEPQI